MFNKTEEEVVILMKDREFLMSLKNSGMTIDEALIRINNIIMEKIAIYEGGQCYQNH